MTRFALAVGGTAGHLYPALAVAAELRRRGADVVFVHTGRPFQRQSIFGKARALLAVVPAVASSRQMLRAKNIAAVIGFGGFAAVGPVLAARSLGIWCAILEPNAVLGMANRLLAPFADRIYTGALTQFQYAKCVRTGLPVRREIVDAAQQERTTVRGRLRVLCFDDTLPLNVDADVISPSDNVAAAYASCDLVVSRAGAGTLAEISILGLPSVIVPLRRAAEDHQMLNASVYAATGAAVVADDGNFNDSVARLISNERERDAIGASVRRLAMPDAARDLVSDAITSVAARAARRPLE